MGIFRLLPISAVSVQHDLNAHVELLRRDGTLTMVGAPGKLLPIEVFGLLARD
jgi:uncharacterized zinc-type alcohol dehydrogenase-like protein